jgi:hypothetical protein
LPSLDELLVDLGGGFSGKKSSKSSKADKKRKSGEEDFIRMTNEALKKTGIFIKYILAVYNEITFLYLHPRVDRAKLNGLFENNPIKLGEPQILNNPLVKMLSKRTSDILKNIKRDTLKNVKSDDHALNGIVKVFAKFYKKIKTHKNSKNISLGGAKKKKKTKKKKKKIKKKEKK